MSEVKNSVGTFDCGHSMEWANSYFDASRMIHCVTCLREGMDAAVKSVVIESPKESVAAEKPSASAVEFVEAPVVHRQGETPVAAPVAAEKPVEKLGTELSPEEHDEMRRAGLHVHEGALIQIPRSKKIKDMTPEEYKEYRKNYQREYLRAKRKMNGKPVIPGGAVKDGALVKIPRDKPLADMSPEERRDYQRRYNNEYNRIKREQANRNPASATESTVRAEEPRVQVMEPETKPLPSQESGFVVRYDAHGVPLWLEGETPQERIKRRQKAANQRYLERQRANQKKQIGSLKTPGAPKPIKVDDTTFAEREEKAKEYRRKYYQQHKERLAARMTVAEAKAAGWTPNEDVFSHAS